MTHIPAYEGKEVEVQQIARPGPVHFYDGRQYVPIGYAPGAGWIYPENVAAWRPKRR